MTKASDKVCPPWKKATLKDRLTDCRRMLHLHDMLTDKDNEKILRRILKSATTAGQGAQVMLEIEQLADQLLADDFALELTHYSDHSWRCALRPTSVYLPTFPSGAGITAEQAIRAAIEHRDYMRSMQNPTPNRER